MATRLRSQVEAFFVLRRNPLELWGAMAYEQEVLDGRFLGRDQIMLNAPNGIRQVRWCQTPPITGRNAATHRVLSPILGDGLFLAEGEAWRHQRRTIAPALAPRTMPILTRHVIDATRAKADELGALVHRPIELLPHLQSLALTIAGQSMFSLEMAGYGPELRALIMRYGLNFARPGPLDLMLPRGVRSPLDRRRAGFRAGWTAFLDRLIEARRALPAEAGRPRDMFDLLGLGTRSRDRRGVLAGAIAGRGLDHDPGRPRDHGGDAVLVPVSGGALSRCAGSDSGGSGSRHRRRGGAANDARPCG